MTVAAVVVVGALVGGALVGWPLAASAARAWRLVRHAESERAWCEFAARLTDDARPADESWSARRSRAWETGTEYYCSCGRRSVTYSGEPPPTCAGVSCVGLEHELRVMREAAGP